MHFLGQQYYLNKDGFRKYVHEQALQGIPLIFLKAAQELIPNIKYFHIEPSKKVGLRAQLFNLKNKTIVKDFYVLMVLKVHILLVLSRQRLQLVFLLQILLSIIIYCLI